MDRGKLFSGLFIMIGLIVLGFMFPWSVAKNRSFDRTVNVKGLCEKEVKADKVIWPIAYKVMADDIQSIYSQTEAGNEVIVEYLKSGGIGEDEITVSVPQISDKLANEYGSSGRAYRYIAKNVVTVYTDKGIVTQGESWENPVEFKYEGLNEIKPEMIEEATKNARQAAQKFAKDSESELGKIKTANQGTFTIEDRDSNTPYIKKVRVVTSVTYYLEN